MAPDKREISMTEVAEHKTDESCWVIIHDKVYDVTKFLNEHPGGGDVILEQAGRDASDPFEDVGHSADARTMLEDYEIGFLPENERGQASQGANTSGGNNATYEQSVLLSPTWSNWLIPTGIAVAIALLYRFFWAKAV